MPSPPESRRKLRVFRIVLAAFSLGLALLVAELCSRLVFRHYLRPSRAKFAVELLAYGRSSTPQYLVSHPYCLYLNAPHGREGQLNELGCRGPAVRMPKPPGSTRILFLGGSTTVSWYTKDFRGVWPFRLGEKLQAATGRDVETINAGLEYATSAEHLADYVFRFRYLDPDVVVIEAGGNDQIAAWYPGYSPEYTHFRGPGSGAVPRKGERVLLKLGLMKLFYFWWLQGCMPIYSAHPIPYQELDRRKVLERVRTCPLDGFARNLDLLVKLARGDGAQVLLVGFLQAERAHLAKGRPEFKGLEQAMDEGWRRHLAVMERVARERQVPLVIPRRERFTDAMFIDNCHLTPEGEALKAEECFEALRRLVEPADARRSVR